MKIMFIVSILFALNFTALAQLTPQDTISVDTSSVTDLVIKFTPNLVQLLNEASPLWRNSIMAEVVGGFNSLLNRIILAKQAKIYNAYQKLSPEEKKAFEKNIQKE